MSTSILVGRPDPQIHAMWESLVSAVVDPAATTVATVLRPASLLNVGAEHSEMRLHKLLKRRLVVELWRTVVWEGYLLQNPG